MGGASEDKRIVCVYDVTDGTVNTAVFGSSDFSVNSIQSIEIDGVNQPTIAKSYLMSAGEHTMKIKMVDDTTIPRNMFYGITALKSLYLPKNFKTIIKQAFRQCSNLISVDMPGIETIGYLGFYNCTKLPAIDLTNVKYLEDGVFYGCSLLADVGSVANLIGISYASDYGEFGKTKVSGDFVFSSFTGTGISASLFNECSGVTSVSFPLSEYTKIGHHAFYKTGIESFVVREGCTELNNHSFGGNATLQYLDLPSTLTTWNGYACYNCTKQKVLVCRAATPPTGLNAYSFLNIASTCKVYVPSASISAYESATGWLKLAGKYVALEGSWYETHREIDPNDE